jgi:hypothetical protein
MVRGRQRPQSVSNKFRIDWLNCFAGWMVGIGMDEIGALAGAAEILTVNGLVSGWAAVLSFASSNAFVTLATKAGRSLRVSKTSFLVPPSSTSYSPNLTRSENDILGSPFNNALNIMNIMLTA